MSVGGGATAKIYEIIIMMSTYTTSCVISWCMCAVGNTV